MRELPISHATHLAGGTLSLTRSAILLNEEDRPVFLRYRMSQAVTIRPVVTVFQIPPTAQQKTPIEFNRRSAIFDEHREFACARFFSKILSHGYSP